MQARLAKEGVWVEPASAAGLAGLANEIQASKMQLAGKTVVVVCTGHGLKDPGIITERMPEARKISVDLAQLEKELSALT
jgi:threonine synthase